MSLQIYRDQIDVIDNNLIKLLEKRILISGLIGKIKRKNGDKLEILDRKEELMKRLKKFSNKISNNNIEKFFSTIFDLSEKYQNRKTRRNNIQRNLNLLVNIG